MSNRFIWVFAVLLLLATAGCFETGIGLGLGGGIFGLIIIIVQVLAIIEIVNSGRDLFSKLIWILLVLTGIGLILYILMGR